MVTSSLGSSLSRVQEALKEAVPPSVSQREPKLSPTVNGLSLYLKHKTHVVDWSTDVTKGNIMVPHTLGAQRWSLAHQTCPVWSDWRTWLQQGFPARSAASRTSPSEKWYWNRKRTLTGWTLARLCTLQFLCEEVDQVPRRTCDEQRYLLFPKPMPSLSACSLFLPSRFLSFFSSIFLSISSSL